MTERKNIDRLFQEKFKDFEIAPPELVWENIEAGLKEKKKRRAIPFWLRLSGVAAALLAGSMISYRLMNPDMKNQNAIVLEKNEGAKPTPAGTENQNIPQSGSISIDSNSAVTSAEPDKNSSESPVQNSGNNPEIQKDNNPGNVVGTDRNSKSNAEADKKTTIQNQLPKSNRPVADVEKANIKKSESGSSLKKGANPNSKTKQQANQNIPENAIANSGSKNKIPTNPNESIAGQPKINEEKNTVPNSNDADKESIAQSDKNTNNTNNNITNTIENKSTGIDKTANPIAEIDADKKPDSTAVATVGPNALEELLNEKENKVTAKEPKLNRWQVASSVAPIYFSSTSNGSPLDSRFESNKKSYKPTVAYGVGVKYALNKKLAVRSGVSTVKLEYNTTDLVFFQTTNARQIQNVSSNIQGSVLQIDNKPTELNIAARAGDNKFDATLNQKTGYIEVPVELSYQLLDKKFGIELIGGVSTLFLNQNEVTLESPGLEMAIGQANNLNSMHFSTNVGMGFKYSFLKAFQANFEPMFKYQINTFSNDAGNFKPYFFGFYTGLSYRF